MVNIPPLRLSVNANYFAILSIQQDILAPHRYKCLSQFCCTCNTEAPHIIYTSPVSVPFPSVIATANACLGALKSPIYIRGAKNSNIVSESDGGQTLHDVLKRHFKEKSNGRTVHLQSLQSQSCDIEKRQPSWYLNDVESAYAFMQVATQTCQNHT